MNATLGHGRLSPSSPCASATELQRCRRRRGSTEVPVRIFIAGGTGAIGRVLVPLLVNEGHTVVALTRSADRASQLEGAGAVPVVGDVYDEIALGRLVAESEADVVIHQLTAFGTTDGDPYAETIRVRIEGTRSLIAAARVPLGSPRFVAQSISFMCSPFGGGLTDEQTPLYLDAPPAVRALAEAVASLERQTLSAQGMSGTVLRYGWFYGPGTTYDPAAPFRLPFARARCRSSATAPGPIRSSICATLRQQHVCTLATGDDPNEVTAVGAVANRTPNPLPYNGDNFDGSSDAHRVVSYYQDPTTLTLEFVDGTGNPTGPSAPNTGG